MSTATLPIGYSRTDEEVSGTMDKGEKLRMWGMFLLLAAVIGVVQDKLFYPDALPIAQKILLILGIAIIVICLHELAHFTSAKMSGLHPRLVFTKVSGYGYCPGITLNGGFFSRSNYIQCLLAPQLLTLLCVFWLNTVSLNEYVFMAMMMNLLGGWLDLKSTFYVLTKHSADTLYLHESTLVTGIYTKEAQNGTT